MQVINHALHVLNILGLLSWTISTTTIIWYCLFEFAHSFHFSERVSCCIGLCHDLWLVQAIRGGNHSLGTHGILTKVRSGF